MIDFQNLLTPSASRLVLNESRTSSEKLDITIFEKGGYFYSFFHVIWYTAFLHITAPDADLSLNV